MLLHEIYYLAVLDKASRIEINLKKREKINRKFFARKKKFSIRVSL